MTAIRLAALVLTLLGAVVGATDTASAHSVSMGYVVVSNGVVTIHYGGYHPGAGPEGDVTITRIGGGYTATKPVAATTSTRPSGLVDGTNNFFATSCSGGSLSTAVIWQSATFTGVPSGQYTIQLTGSFTINWQPCNSNISSPTSIVVIDAAPPVISGLPSNMTLYTPAGSATAIATWTPPTASDDIGITSFTTSHAPGSSFPVGTTTVTYTATDTSGNVTTASFTVTVIDNVPPVLTGMPANITVAAPSNGSTAVASWTPPTASDNVGVASLTSTHAPGSSFPIGTTTVTYTVRDATGNEQQLSFTVTVTDSTAPAIGSCPANQTLQATGPGGVVARWSAPTATDNSGAVTLSQSAGATSGSTFPIGVSNITYTATDASSNSATCSFSITVQDTLPPAFSSVPADVTLEATSPAGAPYPAFTTLPTATDTVSGARPVTATHAPGATFPFTAPGQTVTTVTFAATDTASPANTALASFRVTVRDTTPPTLTSVPANVTVEATGAGGATASYGAAAASDIADPAPAISYSQASGTTFPIGTTTVTVTARDASNNISTGTFTVTVRDTTPPTISGTPSNVTAEATGPAGRVVTYTMPTATDFGTTPITVTSSHPPGTTFPVGVTTVTFTATDSAGNSVTTSFQVNVSDATAPVFSGVPANITVEATGPAGTAVTYTAPTASDVVDGPRPVASSHPSGTTFPLGTTTVTFTASDLASPPNTATATFQVTVRDTTPPVIGAVSNITVTALDLTGANVTSSLPSATDIVDTSVTVSASPASGSLFPIGVTTVTVTAVDDYGNAATKTFTVTVLSPAQMAVTPATGFVSSGPQGQQGAPFAPASQAYVVINNGQVPMDFAVTGASAWAAASPASGNIPAGGSTTVTIALTAAANALAVGAHNATFTFNNATSGIGSTSRTATLTVLAPANMTVTPATAFVASGPQGQQGSTFTPSATTYTVQNTGALPMTFAVTGAPSWATLSAAGGMLAAGASQTITVSLNAGANALAIGTQTATLSFANTTNGFGNTARSVSLTVMEPARLVVTPADGLAANGYQGGPFAPSSKLFTLSNTGAMPLSFAASDDRTWLDVAPASGTIAPGGTTTVTLSVNANANALANGTHSGTLTLTNTTSGIGSTTRPATLTAIPNGQVILRVVTTAGDGTFRFASAAAGLNVSVATSGGAGQSQPITLNPATYSTVLTPPDGFGLTSITCSDSDSRGNVGAKSATIVLASTEVVTCTFASVNSRKKTVEVISNFMSRRNEMLLESGPDSRRQIDRLIEAGDAMGAKGRSAAGQTNEGGSAAAGVGAGSRLGGEPVTFGNAPRGGLEDRMSDLGATQLEPSRGASPFADSGVASEGTGRLAFGASLGQMMRLGAEANERKLQAALGSTDAAGAGSSQLPSTRKLFSPWDVWVQGRYVAFHDRRNNGDTTGHFGAFDAGADYVFNPSLLVGLYAGFDSMHQRSATAAYDIRGRGWMAGPYTTVRLSEHLFLQGRAAMGSSSNIVSPFQTYSDEFTSWRRLASATLTGRWQFGNWDWRPSASISYIEDKSIAYQDSLGVEIPGVKAALGQFKAGPEVSYRYRALNGTLIEPRAGLQVIWNFAGSGPAVDFGGTLRGPEGVRGKLDLGMKMQFTNGASLDLSTSYDGIGSNGYQSIGGKATVRIPLN